MDSEKLSYFISSAYTLNFSEVARKNFISQPTISNQISQLEQELGVKLFYRNGKKLELTSEGEYFLPIAVKLLENIRYASTALQQYSFGGQGHLSIMLSTTSLALYRKCLEVFNSRYPKISIDAMYYETNKQVDLLNKGAFDIYFTAEQIVSPRNDYHYINTVSDSLALVLPKNAPVPEDLNDWSCLSDIPFIALDPTMFSFLITDVEMVLEARNFHPKIISHYNRLEDILIPIDVGSGFSIIPLAVVEESPYDINYIPLPDEFGIVSRVVAWRINNHNRSMELFLDVVRELFSPENKQ